LRVPADERDALRASHARLIDERDALFASRLIEAGSGALPATEAPLLWSAVDAGEAQARPT
jgi:hypothetical protein